MNQTFLIIALVIASLSWLSTLRRLRIEQREGRLTREFLRDANLEIEGRRARDLRPALDALEANGLPFALHYLYPNHPDDLARGKWSASGNVANPQSVPFSVTAFNEATPKLALESLVRNLAEVARRKGW